MAGVFDRNSLETFRRMAMAHAREFGIDANAEFTIYVSLTPEGRDAPLMYDKLTFHHDSGRVDQEAWEGCELATDERSPPSSRLVYVSVVEDESAPTSNLVAELAAFFVNRAKQAIKDQEKV
ncbi:MAG TPA: hypothetical protein VMG10_05035 [Gemmataceae bacterium]|nr:hypothetical protein [Gemmataceae bacterium]